MTQRERRFFRLADYAGYAIYLTGFAVCMWLLYR
jgi:hypothetical protein